MTFPTVLYHETAMLEKHGMHAGDLGPGRWPGSPLDIASFTIAQGHVEALGRCPVKLVMIRRWDGRFCTMRLWQVLPQLLHADFKKMFWFVGDLADRTCRKSSHR